MLEVQLTTRGHLEGVMFHTVLQLVRGHNNILLVVCPNSLLPALASYKTPTHTHVFHVST